MIVALVLLFRRGRSTIERTAGTDEVLRDRLATVLAEVKEAADDAGNYYRAIERAQQAREEKAIERFAMLVQEIRKDRERGAA